MGDKIENECLAEQIINKAIQEVVFEYNAYAPIISSFRIVYTDEIPTMGVDKYARLAVNPEFAVKNQAYMKGIVIHEVLHIFFGHTTDTRGKLAYNEDAQHNKIANIAEDCAINQFIREMLPEGAVNPFTLEEMLNIRSIKRNETAEYYYDLIMDNLPKSEESFINNICSTDKMNSGQMQDALDKMGVEHLSQEEVNDKIFDAAKQISKSSGNQYGALVDFAREMLNPKVDWRPLLQATIRNAEKKVWSIHAKQTFKRVSRRSGQILIPKKYGQKIAVTLSFDTSGSITSDMVNQFLSEVEGCMKYSEIKECALWHTSNYWYGKPEQLEKDVEKIFESGGTDEKCMGIAEQHCKADLHIHFSDGWHGSNFGFQEPKKNIEIIWDGKEIKEIRKEF